MSSRLPANGPLWLAAAAACAVTFAWRFLTFTGFTNDHYAHLALAQQWLLGDRPIRDFTDPGWPLTYAVSAAMWHVAGNAMWVEWLVVSTALAVGAACTVVAAHRLSGLLAIAAIVTILEIIIFPRTYAYPKILTYAMAACVMIAVARRPSLPRLAGMAAVVAAAFLFRHDHGLYIGFAAALCAALAAHTAQGSGPPMPWTNGIAAASRRVALLMALTGAFLLPWVLFVVLNGGLVGYFETAIEFARAEANASNLRAWPRLTFVAGQPIAGVAPAYRPLAQVQWRQDVDPALRRRLEARYSLEFVREGNDSAFYRVRDTSAGNLEALGDDPHVAGASGLGRVNRPRWRELLSMASPLRLAPALHLVTNADAWLFWLFWSLPLLCAVVLARRFGKMERWPGELALVAALIAAGLLVNAGFLRDILRTRFSDAIVPPALLGAWLLGIVWAGRWNRRFWQRAAQAISIVCLFVTAVAVTTIAETGERVALTGITDGFDAIRSRASMVMTLLSRPHRQTLAPPSRRAEALMPFFAYLDRCSSPADRIIVTGESPEVIVLSGRGFASDGAVFGAWYSSAKRQDRTLAKLHMRPALFVLLMDPQAFRDRFPAIDAYVTDAYTKMTDVVVEGAETVPVLVLRSRTASTVDSMTGWPCFSSPAEAGG